MSIIVFSREMVIVWFILVRVVGICKTEIIWDLSSIKFVLMVPIWKTVAIVFNLPRNCMGSVSKVGYGVRKRNAVEATKGLIK